MNTKIIGNMVYSGGMFQDALNCVTSPDIDLGTEITKRLAVLPPMQYVPRTESAEEAASAKRNETFIASDYFSP